ncbi:MAG: phage holin family protein [Prevotella sp.]|nr:phage holin family protein [Prevotella sp.]
MSRGSYILNGFKLGVAAVGALILEHLGGFDVHLNVLVIMICTDFVTGILKALVNKDLQSREMMVGMIRKILIMVCVCLAFEVDKALALHAANAGLNYNIDLRLFVIIYFCVEELLSILENMVVIGVPVPKFVTQFLRTVVIATNSTPNKFLSFLNKIKKADWLGLVEEAENKEKKDREDLDDWATTDEFDADQQNNKGL